MEDGVTEVQSFLPPQSVDSEDGSKIEEKNDEKEEGFVPEAEKSAEDDLGTETEHSGKNCAAKDEAKDSESGGGGGLINNLISTFITPSSPRTEEGGAVGDGGERGAVDNGGGEGGIISNLVSNFFHRSEGEEDVVESEKEKEEEEILVDGKIKRQKTENFEDEANGGGGGGIIHNIVSQLPASLPDDAVPTADEAIILINALVRD